MFFHPFLIGLVLYFASLIVISKIFSRRMTGLMSFFLADRDLPTWVLLIAFLAAWIGAGSTMGTMTTAYKDGWVAAWDIAIPAVLTCLIHAFVLARPIRASGYETIPEAISQSYGPAASIAYALVMLAACIPFMGSQLFASGQIIEHVLHIPALWGVPFIYIAVVIYSVIGGFRSVALTDTVQFVVLMTALAALLAVVLIKQPALSWQPILTHLPQQAHAGDTSLMKHLAITLTFCLGWMIAPELWQRVAALRHENQARRLLLLACATFPIVYGTVLLTGLYATTLIPAAAFPKDGNVFLILADMLPAWLATVVMVGLMAAIASTLDSTMNVSCMTLSRDVMSKFFLRHLSGPQHVLLSRVLCVVIGLPSLWIALVYHDIIQILWISADIFASALFVPLIAVFYAPARYKSPASAGLAMAFGCVPVLLNFGKDMGLWALGDWFPGYPYTTMLGVACSLLGFILGGLLAKKQANGLP